PTGRAQRRNQGTGHLQSFPAPFPRAAVSRTHCALRLPAAEAKPAGRSHRAIQQSRGTLQRDGPGRGRVVLLGTYRAARSRQFETSIEGGGGRGATGNECTSGAVVSALRTTRHGERRPDRGAEIPGPRVRAGAAGTQRGPAVRRSEIAKWRVGGSRGAAGAL